MKRVRRLKLQVGLCMHIIGAVEIKSVGLPVQVVRDDVDCGSVEWVFKPNRPLVVV